MSTMGHIGVDICEYTSFGVYIDINEYRSQIETLNLTQKCPIISVLVVEIHATNAEILAGNSCVDLRQNPR